MKEIKNIGTVALIITGILWVFGSQTGYSLNTLVLSVATCFLSVLCQKVYTWNPALRN